MVRYTSDTLLLQKPYRAWLVKLSNKLKYDMLRLMQIDKIQILKNHRKSGFHIIYLTIDNSFARIMIDELCDTSSIRALSGRVNWVHFLCKWGQPIRRECYSKRICWPVQYLGRSRWRGQILGQWVGSAECRRPIA
jgi:hypothetical protein